MTPSSSKFRGKSWAGWLWDQSVIWTVIGTIGYTFSTSYHLDQAVRRQLEVGRRLDILVQEGQVRYYPTRDVAAYASAAERQRQKQVTNLQEERNYHLQMAINPFAEW